MGLEPRRVRLGLRTRRAGSRTLRARSTGRPSSILVGTISYKKDFEPKFETSCHLNHKF